MIGWNNRTIWLKNRDVRPILIGYDARVPEGCFFFWDHNMSCLIEPGQAVELNLFFFVPDNLGASRFSIGFSLLAYVQTSAQEVYQ
jgi:hypothetical protein